MTFSPTLSPIALAFQEMDPGNSIPSFGMAEDEMVFGLAEETPRPVQTQPDRAIGRVIVPTNQIDMQFIWKVSQLLEISFDRNDPEEMMLLHSVIEECFQEMFVDFNTSPVHYLHMLNGSTSDPVGVPGLPLFQHFMHIERLKIPEVWTAFKTEFRWAAQELYQCALNFANFPTFAGYNLVYEGYPECGGGLSFLLERKGAYQI